MSILIKDVFLRGKKTHIFIEGNSIVSIGKKIGADKTIDAKGMAAMPGLVNCHTHAAMSLLRGYADDMLLSDWLEKKIWPLEAKFTEQDVYWGTKLACLEMIKSGTTCFNDMYFHMNGVAKAADEMGMRAVLSYCCIDFDAEKREKEICAAKKFVSHVERMRNPRISAAIAPHAVYSTSREMLEWSAEFSAEKSLPIHIHLSETEKENLDCKKKTGKSPTELLDSSGVLCERTVCAHGVHLSAKDINILAKRKCSVCHNPVSNMKLAVGGIMPYCELAKAGVNVCLGTDGSASNNSLDMLESLKFAALCQKAKYNDPRVLCAKDALYIATQNGAKALGINCGMLEEGVLADLILVDLKNISLVPGHSIDSDIVYSANGSCVDTTICDGKILMQDRHVAGEEEIVSNAIKRADRISCE